MLEAATEVFLEKGYEKASVEEIISRSGGSRRDIYKWFGSKEALFGAVIAYVGSDLSHNSIVLETDTDDVRGALQRFGERYVSTLTSKRVVSLYRVVIGESMRFPALGRVFYDGGPVVAYRQMEAALRVWSERGLIHVTDYAVTARTVVEMIGANVPPIEVLVDTITPTAEEIARVVHISVDIALHGLRAPGEAPTPT